MEIQWALVMFTVVSGAGAWLFASSMIAALAGRGELPTKLESIVAFVLVAVGGCLSVLHLKHVDRILEALNHPTSGIFVEAAMIGVLCVLIAVCISSCCSAAPERRLEGRGRYCCCGCSGVYVRVRQFLHDGGAFCMGHHHVAAGVFRHGCCCRRGLASADEGRGQGWR